MPGQRAVLDVPSFDILRLREPIQSRITLTAFFQSQLGTSRKKVISVSPLQALVWMIYFLQIP